MLKNILLTIFFTFVMIAPISANLPATAQQVPWSRTDHYVIFNNFHVGGGQFALTSTTPLLHERWFGGLVAGQYISVIGWQQGGTARLFRLINGNWQQEVTGTNAVSCQNTVCVFSGTNDIRRIPEVNRITLQYSSHDIREVNNTLLFQQRPFLLPVMPEPEPTPEQAREGATLEALNQLILRISTDLLTVLPVGLLVLSLLLVIPLLKRWRGFLRL